MDKNKILGAVLAVVSVGLLVFSGVLAFVIVPSKKVLPSDMDEHRYYEGYFKMLNLSKLDYDNTSITIDRHVQA
ncbi:MAG: hypothetical protein QW728_04690, partial [Thermoplasmata archaeon]